jgi:GNAT superfamily N-acetyltransferase
MIEISRPTLNDVEAIASLQEEVHTLHVANAAWYFLAADRSLLAEATRARLLDESTRPLIGRRDGQVIGYVLASARVRPAKHISREYTAIYLDEICVRSDCRRTGVGRLLVEALFTLDREEGIGRVELDAWAFNTDARQFFERLGFQPQMHRLSVTLLRPENLGSGRPVRIIKISPAGG